MQVTGQLRTLKNAFSLLRDRALVKVEGRDASKFLQGLTTNELTVLTKKPPNLSLYANMLTTQGRVAFDVLVSAPPPTLSPSSSSSPSSPSPSSSPSSSSTPPSHSYLIDCAANTVNDLRQYLQKYVLRNKLTITDVSDKYRVWSVFGKDVTYTPLSPDTPPTSPFSFSSPSSSPSSPQSSTVSGSLLQWWEREKRDGVFAMDPRYEKLGARIILPQTETLNLPPTFTEVSDDVYNLYRMRWGVPQGPQEVQKDVALPLEINSELLNGVHFHKGCYLGQELVARTHYSGLIRKRLFPFVVLSENYTNSPPDDEDQLFPNIILDNLAVPIPPSGSTLAVGEQSNKSTVSVARDRKTGKVISGLHDVGLALIRLESLNLQNLADTIVQDENGRKAKILVPCWWHKEVENIKKLSSSM